MIVALAGKARSGKDTIASMLCSSCGFERISLAGPLKSIIRYALDMDERHTDGELKEVIDQRYGKSPREIMQYIGTDVFRGLNGDVWVNLGLKSCREANENGTDVVVSDVRFENELYGLKSIGARVILIEREDFRIKNSDHASEIGLDGVPRGEFDAIIRAKSGEIGKICRLAEEFVLSWRVGEAADGLAELEARTAALKKGLESHRSRW